jgi:hypothetical protein
VAICPPALACHTSIYSLVVVAVELPWTIVCSPIASLFGAIETIVIERTEFIREISGR